MRPALYGLVGQRGWVDVQVIKLSDAVQRLPRESTLFVHGVPPCFLSVGDKMAAAAKQASRHRLVIP